MWCSRASPLQPGMLIITSRLRAARLTYTHGQASSCVCHLRRPQPAEHPSMCRCAQQKLQAIWSQAGTTAPCVGTEVCLQDGRQPTWRPGPLRK
jgi:hypothetical protein